jgi:flavodoxin
MKTLIVYYSLSSNNALLAKEIALRLNCDILRIEEVNRRTKFTILFDKVFNRTPKLKPHGIDLGMYRDFIFISPIWAGGLASPLKAFLMQERQHINQYSFISVCGGREGQREKIRAELISLIHQEPEKVTELWITDLIPAENREDIEFITRFKFTADAISRFESKIEDFLLVHEHLAH